MAQTGPLFNILLFLVITILFYAFKKNPSLDDINTPEYQSKKNTATIIYFILVLLTQFGFNAYILSTMCGESSASRNVMGQAAFYTIIPWTFFFGIVILVLYVFPSFKSAFSDVVGYFWVSTKANNIFVQLLKGKDFSETNDFAAPMNKENIEGKGVDDSSNNNNDTFRFDKKNNNFANKIEKKFWNFFKPAKDNHFDANISNQIELVERRMQLSDEAKGVDTTTTTKNITNDDAKLLIEKICGNPGILINQMLPSNFDSYWNSLSSLFHNDFQGSKADQKKKELFDLVVTRDNVGESMWFFYTGLLVSSIVQFQIASSSCKK